METKYAKETTDNIELMINEVLDEQYTIEQLTSSKSSMTYFIYMFEGGKKCEQKKKNKCYASYAKKSARNTRLNTIQEIYLETTKGQKKLRNDDKG